MPVLGSSMQELLAKVVMTVLTCAVLLSCGSTVSQREDIVAVKKVMAQRKQAIESHDLALYQQLLLPEWDLSMILCIL